MLVHARLAYSTAELLLLYVAVVLRFGGPLRLLLVSTGFPTCSRGHVLHSAPVCVEITVSALAMLGRKLTMFGCFVQVVIGLVGWSAYTKVQTGGGLPAGPSGLLGGAEGLSYLALFAGIIVFALNAAGI